MDITWSFVRVFALLVWEFTPLLLALAAIVIAVGQIVGRIESWGSYDALYWSFITATTVGYGDIRPSRRRGKALAVLIALVGLVFTGIVVAIAVHAATTALSHDDDVDTLRKRIEQIE